MGKNGFFTHNGPISSGKSPFKFKIPTYGTGELYWKHMLTALRESGYDGTLSIEHEDFEFGQFDGLARAYEILNAMIYREPAARCSWKTSISAYQRTFLRTFLHNRKENNDENRIIFQCTTDLSLVEFVDYAGNLGVEMVEIGCGERSAPHSATQLFF